MTALVSSVAPFVDALASCAVCGSSKSPNDNAFGVTTLVLSLLPIAMFALAVFFVMRAHKKAQREAASNIAPPAE